MKIKNTFSRVNKYLHGKNTISEEKNSDENRKKVPKEYLEKYMSKDKDELIGMIFHLTTDNVNLIRQNELMKMELLDQEKQKNKSKEK